MKGNAVYIGKGTKLAQKHYSRKKEARIVLLLVYITGLWLYPLGLTRWTMINNDILYTERKREGGRESKRHYLIIC